MELKKGEGYEKKIKELQKELQYITLSKNLEKMKKNLLVTLADRNWINQAKQLFSTAYWNAGWKGDYMLLSEEIPEKDLKWFKEKGILIKEVKPLYKKRIGSMPPGVLDKFYLFIPYFKKWKNVVYLDSDIIIRNSLENLANVKGFAAVVNFADPRLEHQIVENRKKFFLRRSKGKFNLDEISFNSGVFAFSTDIIKQNSFEELKKLFSKYKKESQFGEQLTLNLYFYKRWIKLPLFYNIHPIYLEKYCGISPKKINGAILHFPRYDKVDKRCWDKGNYFYKEWKFNLERAELIDLNDVHKGKAFNHNNLLPYLEDVNYISLLKESKKFPFVSVVIPTYNRRKNLELVIKSLLLQDYPTNRYEIIIADDGSADGTKELVNSFIKKFPGRLKYCYQRHEGFRAGQARNMGAKYAKGDVLLFLDSDIIALPNLVTNHVCSLKNADCVLGYASGFLSRKKHNFNTIKKMLQKGLNLSKIKIIPEERDLDFDDNRINNSEKNKKIWRNFVSINFSIKKAAFQKLNFNEQFIGWGIEDIELGYRMVKKKYVIKMNKSCIGLSLPHKGNYNYFIPKEKVSSYIKNIILFYSLYPDLDIKEWIFTEVLKRIEEGKDREYLLDNIRKISRKNSARLFFQSIYPKTNPIFILKTIDRILGKVGIFLKEHNPSLYYLIRKNKN